MLVKLWTLKRGSHESVGTDWLTFGKRVGGVHTCFPRLEVSELFSQVLTCIWLL